MSKETATSSSGRNSEGLLPSFVRRVRRPDGAFPSPIERGRFLFSTPTEPVKWNHGVVYSFTADQKFVIASPNTFFLPQPVSGSLTISLMADGHFGPADPIHWPQVMQFDTIYPWMCVIQRRPSDPTDSRLCMWQPLRRQDFIPLLSSAATGLGTVSSELIERIRPIYTEPVDFEAAFTAQHGPNRQLRWLASTLRHAFSSLELPATFRDLVRQHACVQRFWLYTVAWFDWHLGHIRTYKLDNVAYNPLNTEQLMGCFTASPIVAQRLFEAGVPVWVSRPTETLTARDLFETPVEFTPPTALLEFGEATAEEKAMYVDLLQGLATCTVLAGDRHIDWINRQSQHVGDIPVFPASMDQPSASTSAPPSASFTFGRETSATSRGSPGTSTRHENHAASDSVKRARPVPRSQPRNKEARFQPCEFLVLALKFIA